MTGNEHERLALLRDHEQHVVDRIAELTDWLGVIRQKVKVYHAHVDQGTAGELWSAPPAETG